jgi:surfactin synthase thioesterase subunit
MPAAAGDRREMNVSRPGARTFHRFRRSPETRLRLYALPYAGRGASAFSHFTSFLPDEIDFVVVQIPGRESRLGEPCFARLEPLVEALAEAMDGELSGQGTLPYVLFGHSLGGLIAHELARALRRRGARMPLELVVAGRLPPGAPVATTLLHLLPENAFRGAIRELAGTPEEVLQNEELMSIVSPILRADLAVCETYTFHPESPLATPITVYGGLHDVSVPTAVLPLWKEQTSGECRVRLIADTHWFVKPGSPGTLEFEQRFRSDLVRCLGSVRASPAPTSLAPDHGSPGGLTT